jgi:phosphoglycerate dehydrogenase-like enzyme
MRGAALPDDLRGQTVVLIGVGATLGTDICRNTRAHSSLKVIACGAAARKPDDPVDELYSRPRMHARGVLPRADWVVIACPPDK